jgi:hypothetical protein
MMEPSAAAQQQQQEAISKATPASPSLHSSPSAGM